MDIYSEFWAESHSGKNITTTLYTEWIYKMTDVGRKE